MLIHHLFYSPWSQLHYDDITIHGIGVVNQIGLFCKLCVALFVFVSGYGLAVSAPKNISVKSFYWHRFKKLYLNYWYIWLLFVPVSVLAFGRTLNDAYGDHVYQKAFLDFFGLLKIFNMDSYNPTWWFYSLIIILYLLFPLLNKYLYKTPYLTVTIVVCLGLVAFVPGVNLVSGYLYVFITGMILSKIPLSWFNGTRMWHVIIAIILLSVLRFSQSSHKHIVDSLLCVGIAVFLYKISLWEWLRYILEILGKHSMNLFLIHTFIFLFWFSDLIYITRNPFVIFLSLLFSSLVFSILIEWSKKIFGFNKIISYYG